MNKGIDVEIIKDSTNWTGQRLTTFVLKYPRYIHAELMTHRVFSKNSASSRAIPILKMIDNITADSVLPIWTLNQSGMQGKNIEEKDLIDQYNMNWLAKLEIVIGWAKFMSQEGIHKQNVNRLLEPWMHIKIILTGTDFSNWFELRDHKDAQPEIQELARKMKVAMSNSQPQLLQPGEWHIPYDNKYSKGELAVKAFELAPYGFGADREMEDAILDLRLKVSVANCARISFNNVDGTNSTIDGDLAIYKKLVESEPLHASPSEHQGCVPTVKDYSDGYMSISHYVAAPLSNQEEWDYSKTNLITKKGKYVSNLQGWIQLRKLIEELKYKQ